MAYIGAGISRFNTADELTVTGDAQIDTTTLVVDSTNNRVGIGTASPETILQATASSAIIRLTSDANATSGVDFGDSDDTNIGRLLYDNSDNSMRFTTNAGERLRITSGGNVGIGTSSPDSKLHVDSGVSETTDWANLGIISDFPINSNNRIYTSYLLQDSEQYKGAGIGLAYDGTGYKMHFATASSTSSGISTAMTIDRSGNVGIGTTSPSSTLTVEGSIRATHSSGDRIVLNHDGVNGSVTNVGGDFLLYANGAQAMVAHTNGSERLRIDSSGNVGIGTSSPSSAYKLHVDGNSDSDGRIGRFSQDGNNNAIVDIVANGGGTNTEAMLRVRNDTSYFQIGIDSDDHFSIGNDFANTIGTKRFRIRDSGAIDFNTTSNIGTTGDGTLNILVSGGDAINLRHTNNGFHVFNMSQDGATATNYFYFQKNGAAVGSIRCTTSSTAYNTSSDHCLKENVADMTGAIDRVKALAPKRFSWIVDDLDTANVDGFLAHEAQTVVPEAVTGTHNEVEVWREGEELPDGISVGDNKLDEDGNTIPVMQGIDQSKLVPLLTAALQEAIAKIETLEAKVAALEGN